MTGTDELQQTRVALAWIGAALGGLADGGCGCMVVNEERQAGCRIGTQLAARGHLALQDGAGISAATVAISLLVSGHAHGSGSVRARITHAPRAELLHNGTDFTLRQRLEHLLLGWLALPDAADG